MSFHMGKKLTSRGRIAVCAGKLNQWVGFKISAKRNHSQKQQKEILHTHLVSKN